MSPIVDFDEFIGFRIKSSELSQALKVVNDYKRRHNTKYASLSHYVRCAVIKQNREELSKIKVRLNKK